jgi:nitrogen fixation-related uncharacterized protein
VICVLMRAVAILWSKADQFDDVERGNDNALNDIQCI